MKRREFLNTVSASAALAGVSGGTLLAGVRPATANAAGRTAIELAPDIASDLEFDRAEYERRYTGIRRAMGKRGIDVLLITGNREWREGELSNLRYIGAPIDWEQTFVIFPRQGVPSLLFKSGAMAPPFFMYKTVMEFEPVHSPVRAGTRNAADHAPAIASALKKMGLGRGTIGLVSPRLVPAEMLLEMQKAMPRADYVDAERLMLELRYVKSEQEMKFLRRSAYIADRGVAAMIEAAEVGASDWDLFFAMDKACTEAGAPPGGMQLLSTGPWQGRMSLPLFDTRTARRLEPGDVVVPEVTSNYKGYFTQLTVPVVFGEPSPAFRRDAELCGKVYEYMLPRFRPGATVARLDEEGAAYTEEISGGRVGAKFAFQAGEHETSFWHDNIAIAPSMLAYNQPFFYNKKGGPPWHVLGNAVVSTRDSPAVLHQSPMSPVYK